MSFEVRTTPPKVRRIFEDESSMPTGSSPSSIELLDLGDGLARHDHARHAVGAGRRRDVDAGEPVAVGRDRAQHRARSGASIVWK